MADVANDKTLEINPDEAKYLQMRDAASSSGVINHLVS